MGFPERTWYGALSIEGMNFEYIEVSQAIGRAVRKHDWPAVVEMLADCPNVANAIFPKTRAQSTLLHLAAERHAPPECVTELIRLGVFRTVKDAHGRQAHEIAKYNGNEELSRLLEPEFAVDVSLRHLSLIQEMFHGLLRTFMLTFKTPVPLRLPQLSILAEMKDVRVWFPIPMMAGGCNFWLEKEEHEFALHAESWCRISAECMHHRITSTEIALIEEESLSFISFSNDSIEHLNRIEVISNRAEQASLGSRGDQNQIRPIALFDLDGTVRSTGSALYPRAEDVAIYPGVRERLADLRRRGYLLVGFTNQGGVSKGEITHAEVKEANQKTQSLLGTEAFDLIFYCGHYAPRDGRECDCKKPAPGMILDALSALPGSSLAGAFVVGDNPAADRGAAQILALPYVDAHAFRINSVEDTLANIKPTQRATGGLQRDRVLGVMVGLATADAFGAPVEFWSREQVRRTYPDGLREMRASRNWALGEYTDDTDMALLLADSLLERGRLDPKNVAARFQQWARTAKDVGIQIRRVTAMRGYVDHPEDAAREDYAHHPNSAAGNGAVMRCAPVALFHWSDLPMLLADSRRSARITHGDPKAQSSCVLLNAAIVHLLTGGDRREPWRHGLAYLTKNEWAVWSRLPDIAQLGADDLRGNGYTVNSVESAFWSFVTTSSFEEAIERAVSLGEDTDTTAAITGALAGAYYGLAGIPDRWRVKLLNAERIEQTALKLVGLDS